MGAVQRISRVRREYNQFVANETLEDYSLRFTAKSARKWSCLRVANTALGSISFLALEAIGAAITLSYGFSNAVLAISVVGLVIFLTGLPICYYAAKHGIDMDLLTRGAGFGYIGSTITSLIYASFTFIFFAIEAVILAMALQMCFAIPLWMGYLISSLAVIPLVTHGITLISRFQVWTQPVWLVLSLLPFAFIAAQAPAELDGWTRYTGLHGPADGGLSLLAFGAAASVAFSLIAQIGEQVDFLRFLPPQQKVGKLRWWGAMLSAGPGWIVLGVLKLLAGSLLAFLALMHGTPAERALEPTQMYLVGFEYVFASPQLALWVTGFFVVISQLKINVTNAYAGSIAWSNFFSRLTHSHPGRVVWLVFNVLLALLLMGLGVFHALEQVLGWYSNVAIAWIGALVADLVVNKPLGLSPRNVEFKRAYLYDINPVGVGAMVIASAVSISAFTGMLGETLRALSPFLALGVAFVAAPLIAVATRGRFYSARPADAEPGHAAVACVICENRFEPEDMAHCPAYAGPICSLCCSLDVRCEDSCKTGARLSHQVLQALGRVLPRPVVQRLDSSAGHYLGVFMLMIGALAVILYLLYLQEIANASVEPDAAGTVLWKVFFVFTLICGVSSWLLVLAQQSRKVAQEESVRQTQLLMQEIDAHQRTDAQLQKAKEAAEAANLAKSRYVTNISHELRTPLNTVLGYAQLLQRDESIPAHRRDAIEVIRRSSEHLSGLIDGLLDIAKIEAGRFHLHRGEVPLRELLDQVVQMFRLQAASKGLEFRFEGEALPELVYADERRLRQILINLLSNAIKFTERGHVALRLRYLRQLAEFEIEDSGIGIAPEDLERVFMPFERGRMATRVGAPGTGLGLTISKLLVEIMGGKMQVQSTLRVGTTFRFTLMLSQVTSPSVRPAAPRNVRGYLGPRRTVLVTDDEPGHRDLLVAFLEPLGFHVVTAANHHECMELASALPVDLYLLDIGMPGPDGWEVARQLRQVLGSEAPIIMVSANAYESQRGSAGPSFHDDFVVKPVDFWQLLEKIRHHLRLEWLHEEPELLPAPMPALPAELPPVSREALESLWSLGQMGYVRGIHKKLDELDGGDDAARALSQHLRPLVRGFQLNRYMQVLDELRSHVA
jgi:signal transduction histidine kinase/CheY-like chemotaxis protein